MAIANGVYECEPRNESIDFPDLCKWFFNATDEEKITLQTEFASEFIDPSRRPSDSVVRESLPAFIPNCKDVVAELKGSEGYTDREVIDVATVFYALREPERNEARKILAETRWRDQMRVAIFHLRKVGCAPVDPLTLAVTVWSEGHGDDDRRIDQLDEVGRKEFTRLHWLACEALGLPPFAPDLRSLPQCTHSMLQRWQRAYEFAALAGHSQADALQEFARRKFGDDWCDRAEAAEH
jgi:hypothetical protein